MLVGLVQPDDIWKYSTVRKCVFLCVFVHVCLYAPVIISLYHWQDLRFMF